MLKTFLFKKGLCMVDIVDFIYWTKENKVKE